jgi:hypothetical protein
MHTYIVHRIINLFEIKICTVVKINAIQRLGVFQIQTLTNRNEVRNDGIRYAVETIVIIGL